MKPDIVCVNCFFSHLLSRVIVIWQVTFFMITCTARLSKGYSFTILEVITCSYAGALLPVSLLWYHKPAVSVPVRLQTRDNRTMQTIRDQAKATVCGSHPWNSFYTLRCSRLPRRQTHPELGEWYSSPIDFVPKELCAAYRHWTFFIHLAGRLKIPFFRPTTVRPWDKIPSDLFYFPTRASIPPGVAILFCYDLLFILTWNYYFPTRAEKIMWRTCTVCHAAFTSAIMVFEFVTTEGGLVKPALPLPRWLSIRKRREEGLSGIAQEENANAPRPTGREKSTSKSLGQSVQAYLNRYPRRWKRFEQRLRNISPDGDPGKEVSPRHVLMLSIPALLFLICRMYFFVGAWMSLREQPAEVYLTTNRFILPMF